MSDVWPSTSMDLVFFIKLQYNYMGVSKNRGKTPKMDGENNGKPYEQMDDLGVFPYFWFNTHIQVTTASRSR